MTFDCRRCGVEFSRKANLKRHLTAKEICQPTCADLDRNQLLIELNRPQNNEHKCVCEKSFSRKDSQRRHEKTCEAHATARDQGRAVSVGINNGRISQDNNTYNITINNFGHEDLSYLCPKFMKSCVLNKILGFADLVKQIHFNPDHPENRNIWYKNKDFVTVFENGKLKIRVTDEVFNNIRKNAASSLDEFAFNNRELFDQNVEELIDFWWSFGNLNMDKNQIKQANKLIMALLLTQSLDDQNETKP